MGFPGRVGQVSAVRVFALLFPLGFSALVTPAAPCLLLGTDSLAILLGAGSGPSPGPGLPPRPSAGAQGCAMHTIRLWGRVSVPRAHPCPPHSPPGHSRARPKGEGAREAPAPPASLRAPQAKHTLKHNVKVLFFLGGGGGAKHRSSFFPAFWGSSGMAAEGARILP